MLRAVLFLSVSLLFSGCAGVHRQSGHYVQIGPSGGSSSLSRKLGVDENELRRFNPGHSFRPGEWAFIPLKRGVLAKHLRQKWALSSTSLGGRSFLWPVPSSSKISSPFGRRWGRNHNGIVISAPRGTPIVAVDGGKIIYSGRKFSTFGNMIVIRHSGGVYSLYAHNRINYVRLGDRVRPGQVIAEVGNTGRSTGDHLHFEIRLGDEPLNPSSFYRRGQKRPSSPVRTAARRGVFRQSGHLRYRN